MTVGELVSFRNELFFEGAVQLRWLRERPERAREAATHFVFHGPRYHGVSQEEVDAGANTYKLKDTATFLLNTVKALLHPTDNSDQNPFTLAVAGYGSGKSHLGVTIAELLSAPASAVAAHIVEQVKAADKDIGEELHGLLRALDKPVLVTALDGMSNFNLGNELTTAVIRQLRAAGADLEPIQELSPRFKYAEDFVRRNYILRRGEFEATFVDLDVEQICGTLRERDEDMYAQVDTIYFKANGSHIPVEGSESVQDLINTVCDAYCGDQGLFTGFLIIFDEFGRYLEYAADKPLLAGDFALQQIFQGIQDNSTKSRFVGFVQYELKAYLSRLDRRDLLHLQRYITRFDIAEKVHLSTNLETLFAHLIEKRDLQRLETLMDRHNVARRWRELHPILKQTFPSFARVAVWAEFERFYQVIVTGCWPLHPLTTWFLTQQQDIVQSRSALTFIKDALESVAQNEASVDKRFFAVHAAELVLQGMLPEIIAAERTQGGSIAETLQVMLEKYHAQLTIATRGVLAGIMILDKLRAGAREKSTVDLLLQLVTGLDDTTLRASLATLIQDLGVVEWNADFGHYELVTDAATRGQFQQQLRRKLFDISPQKVRDLFFARGQKYAQPNLDDIDPNFAEEHEILTRDWLFAASLAHTDNVDAIIARAFEDWQNAVLPHDAKGRVIYVFIGEQEEPTAVFDRTTTLLQSESDKRNVKKAPIWIVHIHDCDGMIAEHLKRLYVFDEGFSEQEREQFRRFIPEEYERSLPILREAVQLAIRVRSYHVVGLPEMPTGRMKTVGKEIFRALYPDILPFPFDGFSSTKSGAGPRDCAQLTRALIGREVSGNWVTVQPTQMQNRVRQVLVRSWQALGHDGQLALLPGHKGLRQVLAMIESNHQQELERSVGETYRELIAPPYGLNASSAGVLIGLFLARESPPRIVQLDGKSVSLGDWLPQVFPSTSKHWLDERVLRRTRLRFLAEDVVEQWRRFLTEWEFEPQLVKKVRLLDEARHKKAIEPVPEILEDRYQRVEEQALQAFKTVQEYEHWFDRMQQSFEHAAQRHNIDNVLRLGSELAQRVGTMEKNVDQWTVNQREEVVKVLSMLKSFVQENFERWLRNQVCNSPQQVADYRRNMEWAARNLEALTLSHFKEQTESHTRQVISQVEKRHEFRLTFEAAADFVRMPFPVSTTPVKELQEGKNFAESLLQTLDASQKTIGKSADIDELIKNVQKRQKALEQAEEERKRELQNIYGLEITGRNDVDALLTQSLTLKNIFAGTRDSDDVQLIVRQLEIMKTDMETWSALEGSPEEVEAIISKFIEQQCHEPEDDEESDPIWDFREVYTRCKEATVRSIQERSTHWMQSVLPDKDVIESWSIARCDNQLNVVSHPPTFLSVEAKPRLEVVKRIIEERRAYLLEEDRNEKAQKWLKEIEDEMSEPSAFARHSCEQLLNQLRHPLDFIQGAESVRLKILEDQLTRRLDDLDVSSLLERIQRLSERLRINLLQRLKQSFPEDFANS